MLELITTVNGKRDDFVWGPVMLALLVGLRYGKRKDVGNNIFIQRSGDCV